MTAGPAAAPERLDHRTPRARRRGSGRATRRSGRARTRRAGSAGSTSRHGCARTPTACCASRRARRAASGRRRGRPARDGRLVARARGAPAVVRRRELPRPRHDPSAGDPRPRRRGSTSSRTLFVSASKSGSTLETRSHTDYFWKLAPRGEQWVAITDPGSKLAELAHERSLRGRRPRRADDRRPLLGALPVRAPACRADGRRHRRRCSSGPARWPRPAGDDEGNPGLELGLSLGEGVAGRPRQGLPARRRRVRALGRAAARRVDREAGQGARSRPGRARGRARPPGAGGAAARSARARPGVLPLGVRDRRRGLDPRDQPVRPAGRPGREGQDERGAREPGDVELEPEGSVEELLAGAAPPDYVCIQAFVNPTPANEATDRCARRRARRAHRLRRHARLRPALPALHGPAAQGRPRHRALPAGRRGLRRGAADPRAALRLRPADPRPGGGRLRVAARARPAHRAGPARGGRA